MSDLISNAIEASRTRREQQQAEAEKRTLAAEKKAREALSKFIGEKLGLSVDASEAKIFYLTDNGLPSAIIKHDKVRLAIIGMGELSPSGEYQLVCVRQCPQCQDVDLVSGRLSSLADLGDFLEDSIVCETCAERLEIAEFHESICISRY